MKTQRTPNKGGWETNQGAKMYNLVISYIPNHYDENDIIDPQAFSYSISSSSISHYQIGAYFHKQTRKKGASISNRRKLLNSINYKKGDLVKFSKDFCEFVSDIISNWDDHIKEFEYPLSWIEYDNPHSLESYSIKDFQELLNSIRLVGIDAEFKSKGNMCPERFIERLAEWIRESYFAGKEIDGIEDETFLLAFGVLEKQ